MSIEEIQSVVSSINNLFPLASPALIVCAGICFVARRHSWIVPFWVFCVCPVLTFFGLLGYMVFNTSGSGPDGGFVGMGTMFILMTSLFEIIPGILLICACPPKKIWTSVSISASVPAIALSILAMFLGVRFATIPPRKEPAATAFAETYARLNNTGFEEGFRQRAFVNLLENPNTPNRALLKAGMELSNNSRMWYALASNPSLPRAVIEARISDPLVAQNLARNHALPPEFLKILADSSDFNVRTAVSRNTSTPKESLEKLAQDKNSTVRDFARENLKGTLGEFAY